MLARVLAIFASFWVLLQAYLIFTLGWTETQAYDFLINFYYFAVFMFGFVISILLVPLQSLLGGDGVSIGDTFVLMFAALFEIGDMASSLILDIATAPISLLVQLIGLDPVSEAWANFIAVLRSHFSLEGITLRDKAIAIVKANYGIDPTVSEDLSGLLGFATATYLGKKIRSGSTSGQPAPDKGTPAKKTVIEG